MTGVRVFVVQPSGLTRFFGQPVQFVIGGPTYEDLVKWRDIILEKARSYPGLYAVDADYRETTPQYRVAIDRDRAAELGRDVRVDRAHPPDHARLARGDDVRGQGEEYNVILQGTEDERRTPSDLENIYVRSARTGELIPLSNIVTLEERADASALRRYNRMRAITISGGIADGYSMSDCLSFLEKAVREELPSTATISYKGMSQKFKEASGAVIFVFVLALVIAYLVLAAQFESFVSPFVIMLTVPMGVFGAVVGMLLMRVTLNIYSEIGLIMLIGLAAKNGVLIVEFANQLRDRGVEFDEAVFQASRLRLRPIVMTGLSTAIGALPLIFTSGAGAMSRLSLGSVICFGATSGCLLTLFVVPIGYYSPVQVTGLPRRSREEARRPSEDTRAVRGLGPAGHTRARNDEGAAYGRPLRVTPQDAAHDLRGRAGRRTPLGLYALGGLLGSVVDPRHDERDRRSGLLLHRDRARVRAVPVVDRLRAVARPVHVDLVGLGERVRSAEVDVIELERARLGRRRAVLEFRRLGGPVAPEAHLHARHRDAAVRLDRAGERPRRVRQSSSPTVLQPVPSDARDEHDTGGECTAPQECLTFRHLSPSSSRRPLGVRRNKPGRERVVLLLGCRWDTTGGPWQTPRCHADRATQPCLTAKNVPSRG